MCRCGLVSLDHVLRYSQNVEFVLVFVLNRVEEVKSTYIEIAAYPAESFLFLRRWTKEVWCVRPKVEVNTLKHIKISPSRFITTPNISLHSLQSKRLQMHLIHDTFPFLTKLTSQFCQLKVTDETDGISYVS